MGGERAPSGSLLDTRPLGHDDPFVTAAGHAQQARLRLAAIDWIRQVTLDGTEPVTRDQLENDFFFEGERFRLIDTGRGIRKPAGWDAALTIMTAASRSGRVRPYEDDQGTDGCNDTRFAATSAGRRRTEACVWRCSGSCREEQRAMRVASPVESVLRAYCWPRRSGGCTNRSSPAR